MCVWFTHINRLSKMKSSQIYFILNRYFKVLNSALSDSYISFPFLLYFFGAFVCKLGII